MNHTHSPMNYAHLEERIKNLHKALTTKVKGQPQTANKVIDYFRRGESGLSDPRQPRASVVALGPTGVGKTETVKVIAEELFGDPESVVMLYMSSYKTKADLVQFLGTSESQGDLERQLTSVGEKGKILLLDEIEKAHPEMQDLLLQILDEAHIRFHNGNSFSFSNWYIWATSNIGAQISTKGTNPSKTRMQIALIESLKKQMRPEIVERFNCILTYDRLETKTQLEIAQLMVESEIKRLNTISNVNYFPKNITEIVNFVREKGYTPALGARRMREAVRSSLQIAYYNALVQGHTDATIKASVTGIYIE